MIRIRFDGRRLKTFLSARLTGLPCTQAVYRGRPVPEFVEPVVEHELT